MALFPCSVGSHRYGGRQSAAYLGVANGSNAARSKQRLCPTHFADLRQYLEANLHLSAIGEVNQLDDDAVPNGCGHCEAKDGDSTAYATIYPIGADPRQYFTPLCAEHAAAFATKFQIAL